MSKIIFVVNSNKIHLYFWNCIKRILEEFKGSHITIFIDESIDKQKKYSSNTFMNFIDSKFSNIKTNPLEIIDLNLNINYTNNLQIINKLDDLDISDWIILENKQEGSTDKFKNYTKKGFLYLDFHHKDIIHYSLYKQLIKLSIIHCNSKYENWLEIFNVNLKSEIGLKNNMDKILHNYCIYLIKFFKNSDNYSQIAICNTEVFKQTFKSNILINFNIIIYYFQLIVKILLRKIKKTQFNWKIGVQKNEDITFLKQPKNSFWADPFLIKSTNDNLFIYFEELKHDNLGKISCVEINSKFEILQKKDVINTNYHLSFPNVFFKDGNYYMIPESSQNNTLQLYKCKKLPFQWDFKMNLMENIKLIDATWIYYDDLYYIFGNKIEEFEYDNNEKLYLYYSKDLFSKKWKAHVKNPIVTNASLARNAGKFIIENGKIKRISQNCMLGYGENIVINEVKLLSTKDYIEEKVSEILPMNGYVGSHTFNVSENVSVLDFLIKE